MAASDSIWFPCSAENIVRHKSGTYYLQAKISGKKVRKSLKTNNLRQAKVNRDAEMKRLRVSAKRGKLSGKNRTSIGDYLALIEERISQSEEHKDGTTRFYEHKFQLLRKLLPLNKSMETWTRDDVLAFWETISGMSATVCNSVLYLLRKMVKVAMEDGVLISDPTDELKRKRLKIASIEKLPGLEELEKILGTMRANGGEASANMVEFLAWSGLRVGELRALEWSEIGGDWLLVTGGEAGTKNHETRRVPVNARLGALIERLRYAGAAGRVFQILSPRKSLENACERLGMGHLRIHDLRHWFATHCIESGVDIPTVSRWLGHKDGGALAMRVYGHLRDEHSLASARKLG